MKEILIGTHNRHKTREISSLLAGLGVRVKTLNDFPGVPEVDEDGDTLEANALKKAREYAQQTRLLTLADDTGLEVRALNGAPGVYSARFAGENCSFADNNRKLLQMLARAKDRSAVFRCVIACFDPATGKSRTVEGALEGRITESLQGENGFGYDPVFYLPGLKRTLAELTPEEKNSVSHRALALKKAREALAEFLAR